MDDQHDRNGAPMPVPNDGPSMHDLVCADMQQRKQFGLNRYGTLLQAHNGRDALQDAYEEALDLAVYLRQVIEERAIAAQLTDGQRIEQVAARIVGHNHRRLKTHLVYTHGLGAAVVQELHDGQRLIQAHLDHHRFHVDLTHGYQPWGDA